MAQSKFGPYEILAPLGAGGMGEVYRARDPRLQREVALKILTGASSGDTEHQRRFLQEARAASALNHANILVVHDVGSEAGVPYIVSELIDGNSLRKELLRGPLPLKRLLDVAVQIVDGLAAAHDAGIVHRDLKPENIMLTRDGRAKIVDFGLAKVDIPFAVDAPTVTHAGTKAGVILGTVSYMSPEQARGEPATFRSDQFSFGLVLYELATGTHPFRRQTGVQTLSAIMGEDPRPLADPNLKLPAPLRWVISRCLAKEPRQRYGATIDLYHDLATLREHLSEAISADAVASLPATPPRRRRVAAVIALLASLAVASIGVVVWLFPAAPNYAAYRLTPLATESGYQGSPAWSPNGETIAYVAETEGVVQVFTRTLTSTMPAQITKSSFDCRDPFWSPKGDRIFYISAARDKEGFYSISAAGGTPELVMEDVTAAAIAPDGQTLAFFREEGSPSAGRKSFWLASLPGGESRRYAGLASERFVDAAVHFSPNGSSIGIWGAKYFEQAWRIEPPRAFWIIPLPDGAPRQVLSDLPPGWPSFSWLPDNRHIVGTINRPPSGTHLWLLDTQASRVQPVTIGVVNESAPAVSPDGDKVAFNSEQADYDLAEISLDGSPVKTLLATSRNEMDPAWSPVSDQYAFVTDRAGNQQIWLRTRQGGQNMWREEPLVTEKNFSGGPTYLLGTPAFSPDGQQLAFSHYGTQFSIWISRLDGSQPIKLVAGDGDHFQDAPTWSADGNWIAYVGLSATHFTLAKVQKGGQPKVIKYEVTPSTRPQWSPDNRWIACETPQGLTLISPDGSGERVIGETGWFAYGWSADASHVYGLRQSDDTRRLMLTSIDVKTSAQRILAADLGPVPLVNLPARGFTRISGRSFATSLARVRSDMWLLEGFTPPGFLARFWPRRIVLRP
jgi:serine/threonine protein kinase